MINYYNKKLTFLIACLSGISNTHNKMGIKHLNRYLRENCPESIRCINISNQGVIRTS